MSTSALDDRGYCGPLVPDMLPDPIELLMPLPLMPALPMLLPLMELERLR